MIALGHAAEYTHNYLKKTECSPKIIRMGLTLRFNVWGIALSLAVVGLWRLFYVDTIGRTFDSLLLELLVIFGLGILTVFDGYSSFAVKYHKEKGSPDDVQKLARSFRYKVWCIAAVSLIMLGYNSYILKG